MRSTKPCPERMNSTTHNGSRRANTTLQVVEDEAARLVKSLPREHVAKFLPTVGQLTADMITEIQRAVPAYARPLEGYFGTIMRSGVEQAVRRMLDSVGIGGSPSRDWADLYRRIGKVEFHEGRSLDSLQTAYRVGGKVAWRHIADWGIRHQLPMRTLTVLAEAIFVYIDEISALSIEGYTRAQSQSERDKDRRRRRLLHALLNPTRTARESLATLADKAGWQLRDEVAAVALQPADDLQELPVPDLPDDVLMDLDGPSPCLITAQPQQHLAHLAPQLGGRRAAVGPVVAIGDTATSLRLARRCLDLVLRGVIDDSPLTWTEDHLATLCLLGDEFLISELRSRTLAPLARLTSKQRHRTAQTTLAWLETRGSVSDIAQRLGIHPQTVRYRMRQVDSIFGDTLDDPDRRLELEISLRADQALRGQHPTEAEQCPT